MSKEELISRKESLEVTLKKLQELPDNRKFFYNTGILCIEMTKDEIRKILQEEISQIEKTLKEV